MKFTFEVTTSETNNIITLNISYGSMGNSCQRTVRFEAGGDNDNKAAKELVKEIIDNLRLTVKEREEATYEADVLLWYLQKYEANDKKQVEESPNIEQIILEHNEEQ